MGILPMRHFLNTGKMPVPRFSAKRMVLGLPPEIESTNGRAFHWD
jgi:hypothetical protein